MGVRIAVIGGGISGLVAARALAIAASSGRFDGNLDVDLYESTGNLGGKLSSTDLAGITVDTGPESFLARRPEAVTLCRELGLEDHLAPPGASGAFIAIGGDLKRIPSNLALGVPTRLGPLAHSVLEQRILTFRGMSRFAAGFLLPSLLPADIQVDGHHYPASSHAATSDADLGRLIERHMGREVARHLADPLIGGIHAGSIYGMSAAAVFPPILEASKERGSLAVNLARRMSAGGPANSHSKHRDHDAGSNRRANPGSSGGPSSSNSPGSAAAPVFYALEGGMSTLVRALENDIIHRGVTIHKNTPVVALDRLRSRWHLAVSTPTDTAKRASNNTDIGVVTGAAATAGTGQGTAQGTDAKKKGDGGDKLGGGDTYDGIVLALPASAAGRLIQSIAPEVTGMLSRIPYASVSVVTLHIEHPAANDLPDGTGYVVPADSGQMVTACTFLSKKWPHLATDSGALLRVSLGRYRDSRHLSLDEQGLVETVTTELEQILHRHVETRTSLVTRWIDAFPQYRVGHLATVEQVRRILPGIGPVSLAGAAYGGVGIPACIKSGYDATTSILEQLRNAT